MEKFKLKDYSCATVYKINKTELNKIDFSICKQPVETLEAFYTRQITKPDILINGGIFGLSNGNTYFTYRDNSVTYSFMDKYTEGFGITSDGTFTAGNYGKDGKSYVDFICGYPVLIKNGKRYDTTVAKELDHKTRRTVLAYNDNFVFIVIVESPGLNFNQLKSLLLNLGVKEAINLDGGGSTRLLYKGIRESNNLSSRAVDNVVAFYFKEQQQKTVIIAPYILKKGNKGSYVKCLQRCLNGFGFNCGAADGDFGNNTEKAVKQLQSNYNLEVSGIADEGVWKVLTGSK